MSIKKYLLLLFLAIPLFAADFELEEEAFTIGTDLKIVKGGTGMIEERVFNIGTVFEIKGPYACISEQKLFTWGTTYEIKVDGKRIALVEKKIIESMFTFMGNVFVIKDPQGIEIAKSELARGLRPTITVKETNGAVSTLKASGWKYYTWNISQPKDSKLDPRILFIIATSKTAGDNSK